jgi:hypothetical protein
MQEKHAQHPPLTDRSSSLIPKATAQILRSREQQKYILHCGQTGEIEIRAKSELLIQAQIETDGHDEHHCRKIVYDGGTEIE